MLKLKSLLSEGFAWERKAGKPLPSLAEVQAEYERNLRENENAKPDFRDADGDGNEKESWKQAEKDKLKEGWNDPSISELVDTAQRLVDTLTNNMATNSVLQTDEKEQYLKAFASLEKVLNDIKNQAELDEEDEEDDVRGWR